MERSHGWKPMPVILKVIWILLLLGAVLSIVSVFTASKEGFVILGKTIYGLWAANSMFALNILAPVILVIAMYKRYRWAWIWGVMLYLFIIVNEVMMLGHVREMVEPILAEFPDELFELVPDMYQLVYMSAMAGIVLGLLIDLFIMIVFIVKRKYFTAVAE
jgi:hypothetical protein